jgi:hypothetical protein
MKKNMCKKIRKWRKEKYTNNKINKSRNEKMKKNRRSKKENNEHIETSTKKWKEK